MSRRLEGSKGGAVFDSPGEYVPILVNHRTQRQRSAVPPACRCTETMCPVYSVNYVTSLYRTIPLPPVVGERMEVRGHQGIALTRDTV